MSIYFYTNSGKVQDELVRRRLVFLLERKKCLEDLKVRILFERFVLLTDTNFLYDAS